MCNHTEELPTRPSHHRSDLPLELERLILRMLAKDPEMRPSMQNVELALAPMLWHQSARVVDMIA